jgi:hypothetical protein
LLTLLLFDTLPFLGSPWTGIATRSDEHIYSQGGQLAMQEGHAPAPSLSLKWACEPAKRPQGPHAAQVVPPAAQLAVSRALSERDESDADRCAVELTQRGRLILDVSAADLEAAERVHGPFHPTTWHFRNALGEAQRTWARLRAELGSRFLEIALDQPPLAVLTLGDPEGSPARIELILIGGKTYRIEAVAGTNLAPVQWRLTRLNPPLDAGPYYICRLADGSIQCDCAEWTYRIAETNHAQDACCKHVAALSALGRI